VFFLSPTVLLSLHLTVDSSNLRAVKFQEMIVEPSAVLADDAEPISLPEEGEVEDDVSQPAVATTEEVASADKGAPVLPSPPAAHVVEAPSVETINTNIPPPSPSALATAHHIEDINRITYPQGIKSFRVKLNVNTLKGKFW
jgi:translation initiation factor 4G